MIDRRKTDYFLGPFISQVRNALFLPISQVCVREVSIFNQKRLKYSNIYFLVPSQVLSSLVTAATHYYIGRRWDAGRESWVGFVSSLCLNDPGALSDSRKLISTVRRDISCCDGAGCYHNLVAAVTLGETDFIGIFHDQFNQTSSVCQIGQDDLADLFSSTNYESRERTPVIEGKTANLAQCQIYDKMERDVHQALSDFSSADMAILDTYNRESIIPQREGQVRHVAVETIGRNSVVVLVYHNRIEKYSITDKWRWNIELYSTVGQNSKSVALFNNQLYVVNGHGLESVNMNNCAYYRKEGTCLIVKDVTCGWNQQDNLCQLVTQTSPFRAPVPGLVLQSKDQIEIESTVVQKKAIDGTVTLVADTSNDVYDNLEWFDPFQNKLEENETPNYTWFKGANKTMIRIDDTTKYSGVEKLRFTLHYNIRNETTKMVIFEIGHDAPSTPFAPMPTSVTNAEIQSASLGGIVPIIVGIIGVLVIFIIIAIFVFISRTLPKRRRRQSSKKFHLSGSKQASILDSDQSFILHSPDLFERERNTARFEYSIPIDRSGINNSKPDQESFKSDYMSCSSKDLSSSNSEVDQMPKTDEAIIVFPDGTIGRLKANKLKKLKVTFVHLKPNTKNFT